jgi:hypothetical protein
MSSVLSGNLAFLEVTSVVKLLLSDGRDGRLILQQENENGEIYIEGGQVVHAVCHAYIGEPAFRELVLWTSGKFAFDPDGRASQKSIEKDVNQLITEGAQQLEVWKRVKSLIPSYKVPFRKTNREPEGGVKLKARDWEVLAALDDGESSVSDLAGKLNMRDTDVAVVVHTLIEAGVVEAGTAARPVHKEVVDEKFFKTVENELIQLIGPVASIIIDDVIESMGEARSTFPREKVPSLVEAIAGEIYDPAKQLAFQQFMLRQIKSL